MSLTGLVQSGSPLSSVPILHCQYTQTYLLVYSDILADARISSIQCGSVQVSPSDIRSFAKTQVDYILGNNPLKISYMAGFGPKFPQRLHHRGASLPSIHVKPEKISCNEGMSNWYNANLANPNIHVGAVVGGPDSNDQFTDAISSYKQGEPTTYMNAGMVGALAGLVR
eukprot:PITA_28687